MDRVFQTAVFSGYILICFFTSSLCSANYVIKQKDGVELIWEAYRVEGAFYCTATNVGKQCIAKKDVISITEVRTDSSSAVPSTEDRSSFGHGFSQKTLVKRCEEMASEKYLNPEFVTNGGQVNETGGRVWLHMRHMQKSANGSLTRVSYFTTCALEKSGGRWAIQMKMKKM